MQEHLPAMQTRRTELTAVLLDEVTAQRTEVGKARVAIGLPALIAEKTVNLVPNLDSAVKDTKLFIAEKVWIFSWVSSTNMFADGFQA